MNDNNSRHSFQLKLLVIINDLRLRGKWPELALGLKYLNGIINRHYLDPYWKFLYQIVYRQLPKSIETIPQFIDCLQTLNIRKQNEAIYSFVYLLLSKNLFSLATDLLQLYHLTAKYESEENTNNLILLLNADLQYIKWKKSIKDKNIDFEEQNAEKCIFQLQNIIQKNDISDCQIKKLADIYSHYERYHELEEVLQEYVLKHPDYINAYKYLFEFYMEHNNAPSFDIFNQITKLSPSDSFVLKYCKKFDNLVMSIDCMFDILDFFQWKFNEECWTYFSQLLFFTLPDRTMNDSLKNCINENWTIRKSFWAPYHFRHFNRNRKFKKINLIKLNVAILLLGGDNRFVNGILKAYGLNKERYHLAVERHNWLKN